MTSPDFETLQVSAQAVIFKTSLPTSETIRFEISRLRNVYEVTDDEAEQLAREFEARHQITIGKANILKSETFRPWLPAAKAKIDPYYWNRYRQLLIQNGRARSVVEGLDEVTDRILGLLQNPELEGPWDRRGMVVGHVQSGKTANYTGLLAKAADAGYGLIIVIAGIHNSLRNQTQQRIDEGFIGRDSADIRKGATREPVGVGLFSSERRPATFTTRKRDFNSATADAVGIQISDLKVPAVLVIKKNPSTLKNLTEWLAVHNANRGSDKIDVPLLLIDDEADNASINIQHGKGAVARINGQIRQLLNLFERKCYLGYTATPFANIFIDPDTDDAMFEQDLFPRDFIVSLDPPSNYVGPTRIFVEEPKKFVRSIDDNEDLLPVVHKIDLEVIALPESLRTAVRTFLLNNAVRRVRGQTEKHNSMLINVSRFTRVQEQVWSLVRIYLGEISDAVRAHGSRPIPVAERDPDIKDLATTWSKQFAFVEETWEQVFPHLLEAVAPVQVLQINSASSSALNYDEYKTTGLSAIAIGGFSLSRGLTLEGLSVSYLLRNSKAYDTLLQMGRWFGYRPGYEDLCRVWMTDEAEGWYEHLADSIEELRADFRTMEQANATPREFGLRVRSHPDSLIVTARNRIGVGERAVVRVGLKNKFVETHTLRPSATSSNRDAAKKLFAELEGLGLPLPMERNDDEGYLIRGAPFEPIAKFLNSFDNHPLSIHTEPALVRGFIESQPTGALEQWDVLLASTKKGSKYDFCNRRASMMRTVGSSSDQDTLRIGNKQRVATRGIERVGLAPDLVEKAVEEWKGIAANSGKEVPDRMYRAKRDRPLLIVYPLELRKSDPKSSYEPPEGPVIAWGMSFPDSESLRDDPIEYVVNQVWLEEHIRGGDDIDDDPELGEFND